MGIFNTYKGLPKSIYVLFFVQIINRFGDFVVPFLTLFLVKKLGFTMGQTGFVVTLCALAIMPGALLGGKLSDHIGRKKAYIIFQSSAATLLLICGFLGTSKLLVALVILSAFFSGGVRPILSAIITDVLPPEQRQAGFSLSYLGINLGVAFGPMVAGFLFNHYLPMIFIGDAITSFVAVFLVIMKIKESKPDLEAVHHSEHEKPEKGNILTVLMKRPEILWFFIINILFSVTYGQHTFALPVQLNEQFQLKGPTYFGFMMSINAVTVVALTLPLNHLTRQLKPLSIMSICGVLYAIGFGMIAFIDTIWLYAVSTIIWSVGEIMAATSFGVYLANRSPQNFRARISAVSSFFYAIGAVIGTSGMGLFTDQFGLKALWILLFCLCLIGSAAMKLLED